MPSRQTIAAAGLALLSARSVAGNPLIMSRDPPTALPQLATDDDLYWQPAVDFDTDGCYNVPAIDADGNVCPGLDPDSGNSDECHDLSDLQNNNVYARQRCNNGWCITIYDYYFEKDTALGALGGHRNDWEHIAVGYQDGVAKFVSASQHGDWEVKAAEDVRWDGNHPKMVYNKDGASTHNWRFANEDDDNIENDTGAWFYGDLVSWEGFPNDGVDVRDILVNYDFGSATLALKDDQFENNLDGARADFAPEFDTTLDDGSPGTPNPNATAV